MSTPSSVAKSFASMVASLRHIRAYAAPGRGAFLWSRSRFPRGRDGPTPRATARHHSAFVSSSGLNASTCRSRAEYNASRNRSLSVSVSVSVSSPDVVSSATVPRVSVPSVTCPQRSMLASCGVISSGFSRASRAAAARMAPRVASSGIVRSLAYDQTRLETCCHSTSAWPKRARNAFGTGPLFFPLSPLRSRRLQRLPPPGPDATIPRETSVCRRRSIAAQVRGDGAFPSVAHAHSVSETSMGDANGACLSAAASSARHRESAGATFRDA
mmetsp:Transcript_8754/g.36963  ORF Transcript_8754/g.36963 Transcript_8754/m.36963 type:complete len:271 (-) Transcript_8754:1307-2119(-)